jgi:predicted pyridoxine 5'-phosphate oxidase superfamily flavin-nucleotide-binding protein
MAMLTQELLDLATAGPVVIVGSGDASGVPEVSRAWGVHLLADVDEIVVCVPSTSGRRVVANLESTGRVAVTITGPQTYRSFQVKGRVLSIGMASREDLERVAAHQRAFVEAVAAVGMSRELVPGLYADADPDRQDLTAVRITVEALFDQTPGPGAGARV